MAGELERKSDDIRTAHELAERLLGSNLLYEPRVIEEFKIGLRAWETKQYERRWLFRLNQAWRYRVLPTSPVVRYLYKDYWPGPPSAAAKVTCHELIDESGMRHVKPDYPWATLLDHLWAEMDAGMRPIQLALLDNRPEDVLVLKTDEDALLVDVFNPRARAAILPRRDGRLRRNELHLWALRAVEHNPAVVRVNIYQAVIGFLTVFIQNLRAACKTFDSGYTPRVRFTVNSNNPGYQVEYYPQYNYSPAVFGSTLTTPVVGTLAVGHYRFQGWKDGGLVRDRGLYFADLDSTEAQMRDF